MQDLVFFVGKGGVGKTTTSSAYAVRAAYQHSRVLLVSTDPAHSLSDIFQSKTGSTPKRIRVAPRRVLSAWEVDSQTAFRSFVNQHKPELIRAVESGSLFTAEEISSLLDTALPGMSEMGALLAIHDAVESGKYSTIVVDTAPFGHTLRLFGLPEQFARLLNFLELAAERDQILAQHFGGNVSGAGRGFIGDWRNKLQRIKKSFESARLFLVTTPENFALRESVRCIRELRKSDPSMKVSAVVLNRVVEKTGGCVVCRTRAESALVAQRRLRKEYKDADLYVAPDPGSAILGSGQLLRFAESVFGHKRLKWGAQKQSARISPVKVSPAGWPRMAAPLTFVLGKGGVGKTTISAALGFHSRQKSKERVEICSVDPAPSLDEVFQADINDHPRPVLGDSRFCASELDSLALYKSWVGDMRSEIESATSARHSGVQVDLTYERRLFSELLEIVPPGLDEVLAIFRIIDLSQSPSRKVIVDMAPTGHALELLRTPERILVWARLLLKSLASHRTLALAREVAVKIAELEVRARELSQALKGEGAVVYAVMLPELLPDRETERLIAELAAIGITPEAAFVNRVLGLGGLLGTGAAVRGKTSKACMRCYSEAAWQSQILSTLKKKLGLSAIYLIPAFGSGPSGKRGLRQITQNLWQLS